MRVPGVEALTKVPVPRIVRAAVTPVVERSTALALSALMFTDALIDDLIAEVVRRVDLDEAVSRVDLDAAVERVDIEKVLDRLDLTETVLQRVDLDVVVRRVLEQVDGESIDAVVAKVDLDSAARQLDIELILDRMDLTETVLKRVDLVRVVDAVLTQMDLIALANEIIDGVDLPEIIRDSTGSMASETVKGVRMQGIGADQAVDRAIDRLLLRRTRTPGPAGS